VSDRRSVAPPSEQLAGPHEMEPIERLVRVVLLVGIAVSVALMAVGIVLAAVQDGPFPTGVVPVRELPRGLADFDAAAYLSLGLIVLVGTPFVRVAGSIVAFALAHDRRYVAVTAVVFLVMCLSVVLGAA
jgi:uncharacterized membrane protein